MNAPTFDLVKFAIYPVIGIQSVIMDLVKFVCAEVPGHPLGRAVPRGGSQAFAIFGMFLVQSVGSQALLWVYASTGSGGHRDVARSRCRPGSWPSIWLPRPPQGVDDKKCYWGFMNFDHEIERISELGMH